MKRKYSAPAARKAMMMLEVMASDEKSFSATELANRLNIAVNSVFRILKELESMQYIVQNDDSTYTLTPKLYYLGSSIGDRISLKATAQPFLDRISILTKETVILTTFGRHFSTLIVDQKISSEPIKFISTIGLEYDSYSSAMGKAMLAYISPQKLEHYLEYTNFKKVTEHTIVTRKALIAELKTIQNQGYATDREESVIGLTCIAAPVFSTNGWLEGAIGISGLKFRLTEDIISKYAAVICDEAKQLSSILGYHQEE